MTSDDRRSEHFIREVDEELRRAQMKAIWDRFAPLIIGVCVLVVLITAGYRGWIWWQARQAEQAGDRFLAAVAKLDGPERAAGEAELAEIISQEGAGYAALAHFRLAGEKAAAGAKSDALVEYDRIAASADISEAMRGLARVRAALLALDLGDLDGAEERAKPLDEAGNAWRHGAREVLGAVAYARGELQAARDIFAAMQQDAETPPNLWARSGMMVGLIDGQLAAPGAAAPQPGAGSPAPADTPPDAQASPPPSPGPAPASLPVPEGEAPVLPEAAGAFDPAPPPQEPGAGPAAGAAPASLPTVAAPEAPPAPTPAPQPAPAPAPAPQPAPQLAPAPAPALQSAPTPSPEPGVAPPAPGAPAPPASDAAQPPSPPQPAPLIPPQ